MAVITISRGTKSGGEKLARLLSERLGYTTLSREVIIECAKKYNIMEEELFKRLEASPSLWQKFTREHKRYLIYVRCALIDVVKRDNVIYHGYAGQLFLKGIKHVLKVRLEAPLEDRIRIVMDEQNMSYEKAHEYIQKVDEQRKRWVKYAYGEEWRDLSLYDLSFYTSNMSLDTVCEIIALTVNREEFQTTEASLQRLNDLSLECEVQAAFAADDKAWQLPVTVEADRGTVSLRGAVKDAKQRDMLVEIASKVKGVVECRADVQLLSGRLSKGAYGPG